MIDRDPKPQHASVKDYDALVDFPVEIVGREGGVRRYSFEEAVQLYQRRVASAASRFEDAEATRREIDHCRGRLAQLRRSYAVRFGWTAIRAADTPGLLAGDFAGEIATFLRRAMGATEVEPDELQVALLDEDEHHDLYSVRVRGASVGEVQNGAAPRSDPQWRTLVFRFRERGSCLARERFFQMIKEFQGASSDDPASERMVAFHHTRDFGIILITAASVGRGHPLAVDWLDLGASRDDALRAGIAALRQGNPEEALRLFVATYEAEHFRRSAYVGALVVADTLGAWEQAAATAGMAAVYFPADPMVLWHRALSAIRAGESAAADLERLRAVAGVRPAVQLLAGIDALSRGRVRSARRTLTAIASSLAAQEPDLAPVARQLRALITQRDLVAGLGSLIGGVGLVLGLLLGPWMLVLSLIGASTVLLAQTQLHHRLRRALRRPGADGLRLGNPLGLRMVPARKPERVQG